MNANLELVRIRDVLGEFSEASANGEEELTSRDISSNVTHSGDIDAMQHIRLKLACLLQPHLIEEETYMTSELSCLFCSKFLETSQRDFRIIR